MKRLVAGAAFATAAAFAFVIRAWLTDDHRDLVDGLILSAVFSALFVAVTIHAFRQAKRDRARALAREPSNRL